MMVHTAAKELAPDSVAAQQGVPLTARDDDGNRLDGNRLDATDWWISQLHPTGVHSARGGDGGGGGAAAYDDDWEWDEKLNGSSWWMSGVYDSGPIQWSLPSTGGAKQSSGSGGPAAAVAQGPGSSSGYDPLDDADYLGALMFGTPRPDGTLNNGKMSARGGTGLTPRGTLAALSSARGRTGSALSLGMPLRQATGGGEGGASKGMRKLEIEEVEGETPRGTDDPFAAERVDLTFASDWVEKMFLTPRSASFVGADMRHDIDREMAEAAKWLNSSFGATPRDGSGGGANDDDDWVIVSTTPRMTPRASQPASAQGTNQKADDAVFRAAMQATLATPRAGTPTMVDDAMRRVLSKSFEALKVGDKRSHAHGYSVEL